jgi:hypothetical protein
VLAEATGTEGWELAVDHSVEIGHLVGEALVGLLLRER